jgi:hypothetical protein
MELQFRKRPAKNLEQGHPGDEAAATAPAHADHCNVLVTTGIHRGRFPIGGMTIQQARRTLTKLIKIDPQAVPVINGAPVDENTVIGSDVSMLSFVKPSSLKG